MKKIYLGLLLVALFGGHVIAQSRGELLIKNATVLTAAKGTLENTDILIKDGKISKIGKNLSGGDDYELCFVAAPGAVTEHLTAFEAETGCALTCVGRVESGEGVHLLAPGGRRSGGRRHGPTVCSVHAWNARTLLP